jgi:hypothetical protein
LHLNGSVHVGDTVVGDVLLPLLLLYVEHA